QAAARPCRRWLRAYPRPARGACASIAGAGRRTGRPATHTRAADPGAVGSWPAEPRDRRQAVPLGRDRQMVFEAAVPQSRGTQTHRSHRPRPRARPNQRLSPAPQENRPFSPLSGGDGFCSAFLGSPASDKQNGNFRHRPRVAGCRGGDAALNVANLLVRAARCFAKRPAVALGCRVLHDYEQLGARVTALAGALRTRLDLQPGDRVAIVMKNSPAYIEALFATWHAGAVAVPVNAKLAAREIAYILQDCGARLCFTGGALAELLRPLQPELPALAHLIDVEAGEEYQALFAAAPLEMQPCDPSAPAWLF